MKKLKIYHEKYQKTSLMLFCLVFCNLSTPCYSQSFLSKLFKSDGTRRKSMYEKHSEISFGIGTSNYYGDLAPYNRPIKSTLQNINWNIGVDFTHPFTRRSLRTRIIRWYFCHWVMVENGDSSKHVGV